MDGYRRVYSGKAAVAVMGVRWITKKNRLPKMQAAAGSLQGRGTRVFVGGGNGWLAGIHEYGCVIPVTEKMRAFLHHRGVHLRADTKQIVIPERSFMRAGFDDCHEEVLAGVKKVLASVLIGEAPVNALCEKTGEALKQGIREYALQLGSPANSPLTVAMKGGSNPLVDTGGMIAGITCEVE